jgi:hypothetical protein
MILSFNGYAASGVELSRELAQQRPYLDLASGIHAYALACAGREEEARILLERLQWMSRERYVMRSFAPAALLVLGDPEGALAELRAAAEQRCPWFFQMLADPRLQLLQGRPEFDSLKAVLARMEAEAADGLELESVD